MTSSGQIEIRSYGLPLVRFKRWLLNRCLPYFRETCLSYIPGTRQFRCRYRRQIAREAIKGLKLFKELQALDFEAKRRLGYQVRKYENQWAVMFVGRRRIGTVSVLIFLIIVAMIAIYSLPSNIAQAYLAVPTIIEKIGWASFTINMLIIVIAVVISFLLGLVVIPAIVQWYPRFILPLLSLVSMLLLGIPIYLDISTGKHPWDVASSIFPLNHSIPLALSTSIIIFFFWLVLIKVAFDRQLRAFHPDALLVHILLNILSIVEKQPRRWPELSFRRQLIPMLEEAATCIQNGLSRQYWSGDGIIDLWLQDTATRQAASLRELKKWVLIPKSDTRNQFIVRIVAGLSQITSGNWDALEQRDPEKISRLQWWRSHAATASRAVFMAILPGFLWWALQQTSLALKGVPAEYVTVGVYIWAALTLIMACDPLFGLKATAFKEVVQSLPGLGSLLGKDKKG